MNAITIGKGDRTDSTFLVISFAKIVYRRTKPNSRMQFDKTVSKAGE
jgi:hypothetical protein